MIPTLPRIRAQVRMLDKTLWDLLSPGGPATEADLLRIEAQYEAERLYETEQPRNQDEAR